MGNYYYIHIQCNGKFFALMQHLDRACTREETREAARGQAFEMKSALPLRLSVLCSMNIWRQTLQNEIDLFE